MVCIYKKSMAFQIWSGTYGIVIIGLFVVLLVGSLCFAIYIYILRRRKFNGMKNLSSHKYAIVEQNPDNLVKIKQNQIQPPTQVKVKLVPSPSHYPQHRTLSRTRKKMIRYSEIDEEANEEDEERINNTFQKSIRNYKYKIIELLGGNGTIGTIEEEEDISKPCVVTVNDRNNSFKRQSSVRLQRADSSLQNESTLGQVDFILLYSSSEEFLTVNLLSGRQLHSSDMQYTVNLPVVSIQIEGCPDTEVTSSPDEAPNPEYDQEFTFDGMGVQKLLTTVLRFVVWDIISPHGHETRVVGFFFVQLKHFHKLLVEKGESGAIRREISAYLCEEKREFAGELLLSLMYDCVTDRIVVTIRKIKGILLRQDDVDLYLKVSLLLDNDIIQSKRSSTFTSAASININQTFEFNALSADLELLTNTTEFSKMSLELKDKEMEIKSTSSETLRHNMGIKCSIRAMTTNKLKRVVGSLQVGRTNSSAASDEQFHWDEMVRHFDNTITQWHLLKFND